MDIRAILLASGLTSWPMLAFGQAVTFADLQGAVIEVGAVRQMRVSREGSVRSPEVHTTGQIKIGPGDTIVTTFANTAIRDGRARAGTPGSGKFTLGEPRKTRDGDDVVWMFANNSLVRLRAHGQDGAGGQKMTIAFQRSPSSLLCVFSIEFAREDNVAEIRTHSRIDGKLVQILESKQVSSNCKVVKSDQ